MQQKPTQATTKKNEGWVLFTFIDVGDNLQQPFFILEHEDLTEMEIVKAKINRKTRQLSAIVGEIVYTCDEGGNEKLLIEPRNGLSGFEYGDMIPFAELIEFFARIEQMNAKEHKPKRFLLKRMLS